MNMKGKVNVLYGREEAFQLRFSVLTPRRRLKSFLATAENSSNNKTKTNEMNTILFPFASHFKFYDSNLQSKKREETFHVELSFIDNTLFTSDLFLSLSEFPSLTCESIRRRR